MTIHKTYHRSAHTDGRLMTEYTEVAGAPDFTSANAIHNTTHVALVIELGVRVLDALESIHPAATRVFMKREAPYVKG
jgi:hypothetical protein